MAIQLPALRHGVHAAILRALPNQLDRLAQVQVLELPEVDAAAAGLHLAQLFGVLLDEVAALRGDADVEAVVGLAHGQPDGEPLALPATGRTVAILAVADDGSAHAARHIRRQFRHRLADGLVHGRHLGAAIIGQRGKECGDGRGLFQS